MHLISLRSKGDRKVSRTNNWKNNCYEQSDERLQTTDPWGIWIPNKITKKKFTPAYSIMKLWPMTKTSDKELVKSQWNDYKD